VQSKTQESEDFHSRKGRCGATRRIGAIRCHTKDLERKKEWERQHRAERLARRRELRQIAADQGMTRPVPANQESSGGGFLIPMIAGGALAAYNPTLGMGAGGLTLVVAAVLKKNWV
jgi:hypothetical protein